MKRPEILGKVVPHYDKDWSVHPEQVRVSFDDGSTAIYDIRREMPHPVILENIRTIRKWKTGYVNKPERRRKR